MYNTLFNFRKHSVNMTMPIQTKPENEKNETGVAEAGEIAIVKSAVRQALKQSTAMASCGNILNHVTVTKRDVKHRN